MLVSVGECPQEFYAVMELALKKSRFFRFENRQKIGLKNTSKAMSRNQLNAVLSA
jgi:hypothetical protein